MLELVDVVLTDVQLDPALQGEQALVGPTLAGHERVAGRLLGRVLPGLTRRLRNGHFLLQFVFTKAVTRPGQPRRRPKAPERGFHRLGSKG